MRSRNIAAIGVVAATLVLGGCATVPTADTMQKAIAGYQLPRAAEPGRAMVYVVRPSALGGLVRFNVFLNNQDPQSEVGFTRGSQYIYFSVPEGTHKILSKAENWAEASVAVKSGDVVFIQQDASIGLVMARNALARLDEVQGRFQVMKLTPGTIIKATP